MKQYVADGYKAEGTRYDDASDTVARRDGQVFDPETRGIGTDHGSPLAPAGKVSHAGDCLGQGVNGVPCDIRFENEVGPGAGTSRTLPFRPTDEALAPAAYRWALPE